MATPSLAMVPSGYKDGKLYSVLPNNAGGDFDVTRGSLATRVNKDGLIEPVGTLGADVVLNGDFEETGADQVLNGDFSQEGSEEITNGDFSTDSDWIKQGGWSISGGKAIAVNVPNTQRLQSNNEPSVIGKTYKYSFEASNISGFYTVYIYGVNVLALINTEGLVEGTFVATSTNGAFYISGASVNGLATGEFDNVSVVEVGQDWTLTDSSWSIGEDKIIGVNGINYGVYQSILVSGKKYKISYEVKDYVSGSFGIRANTVGGITVSANGVYTDYITSNGTNLHLMGSGTFNGSITNITVEEVGQEWVLSDGCSITAQGARITSDGTFEYIEQSNVMVIGDTYEVEYEITESVSGLLSVTSSFGSGIILKKTVGVHKFYGVATGTQLQVKRNATCDITIDNIKVKRLNGDDTPRIDYTDGGCPVLLTEPQSTNLVTQSNDFSDASWVKQGFGTATAPTVTSNFAISPDGNLNADRVIFDLNGGSTSDDFSQMNWVGSILNGDASASVYIKSNTNESYVMSFTTPSGSARQITVTPNWQRFSTFTLGISQSPTLRIRLRSGIESTSDYADVSIYGAQIEELSYPTSYIPTYGAVRTRLQDSVTGAGTVSDFNDSEGVLFVEISFLSKSNGTEQFKSISINDGSTSNIVTFESRSVENELKVIIRASGVQVMTSTQVLTDLTSMVKIAIKWKENDFSWWVNGVEVATDNIGLTPIGLSNLSLDGGGLGDFFGKTSQVQVFNTALSDFELQQLTTI